MSVDTTGLLVFLAVMTGTPGPANMLLLSAAARHRARRAIPFFLGVIGGMQFIVWPLGLGLVTLGEHAPATYQLLRWGCAVYILWLAWQIAETRIETRPELSCAPGFGRGLLVHPLNPKAWTIGAGAFTQFVTPHSDPVSATAFVAVATLVVGVLLQGLWFCSGDGVARVLAGRPAERWVMRALALLTVLSVVLALR